MDTSEQYKIVHFSLFRPHNALFKSARNDRAEATTISCNNSSDCELFSRGQCAFIGFGANRCPYGQYHKETGFTKRAGKYSSWIREQEEKHQGIQCLSCPTKVMTVVGDYVYLPYAHMTMNEDVPFSQHSHFLTSGNCFIERVHFTVDNIINLVEFRPHAMMGGEIKSYQKEEVPKFLQHLKEQMPKLFNAVTQKSDHAMKLLGEFSNIGRKAILETLTPNMGQFKDIHGGLWTWDGKALRSTNSKTSFMLVNKIKELILIPEDNQKVTITDEQQVNNNTVFLD